MEDIAVAGLVVLGANGLSRDCSEKLEDFIERDPAAGPAIENLAGNSRGLASAQSNVHDIIDVGEIAGLLTVTVNNRRSAVYNSEHETGEHAGILRCWILARTKNIEVTDGDVLQTVGAPKYLRVHLAYELRHAIRRNGRGGHSLDLG